MSHFTVLVIGDDPEGQMEPYDENREVEEYERKCYCVGKKAERDAGKKVDVKYKSIDQLRNEFHKLSAEKQTNRNWMKFIAKYQRLEKKYARAHKLYNKPDPDCDECKGTGKEKSTYNPDSKWDWYSVGGRWLGYFKLKAGVKKIRRGVGHSGLGDNPPKFDTDSCLKGEIDWEGMKEGEEKIAGKFYDDTMAEVKKDKVKMDSLEFIYGIEPGETRAHYIKRASEEPSTFAVVKDGVWYEKGKMGWWAMVSDEKGEKKWKAEWKKLVDSVPDDTLFTLYDCHI